MTESAGAAGEALPAQAVTGPGTTPVQEIALALLEVAAADEAVHRMRDKVAKAQRAAQELADTAGQGLDEAMSAAEGALARARELTGYDDDGQVLDVARQLAAEHARHQAELAKLAGLGGGE